MAEIPYFVVARDGSKGGVRVPGLKPRWEFLLSRPSGKAVPLPLIVEVQGGVYEFRLDPAVLGDCIGIVDLGAALVQDQDRYREVAIYRGDVPAATLPAPDYAESITLDDTDPGFSVAGKGWTQSPTGYHDTHRESARAGDYAAWSFAALTPGRYRVLAYWPVDPGRNDRARYELSTVGAAAAVEVDQRQAPAGPVAQGVAWRELCVLPISSDYLNVTVTAQGKGTLVADALRLERLVEPTPPTPTGGT